MRRGGSGFAMESKFFETSIEEVGEKLLGKILEKSEGFSSWIKFGELSLCCLLRGVETCCRDEVGRRCNKAWVENG